MTAWATMLLVSLLGGGANPVAPAVPLHHTTVGGSAGSEGTMLGLRQEPKMQAILAICMGTTSVTIAQPPGQWVDRFSAPAPVRWVSKANGRLAVHEDAEVAGNRALEWSFDLSSTSYCWAYKVLVPQVDAREFIGIALRCRASSIPADLGAVLKSGPGGARQFESLGRTYLLEQEDWRWCFFPFAAFDGLDSEQLAELSMAGVVVKRRAKGGTGAIVIDDICLVAPEAVAPAPELRAPPDGGAFTAATGLSWQATTRAAGYLLELLRPEEPETTLRWTLSTPDWSLADASDLDDGVWQWSVRATGGAYFDGLTSVPRTFVLDRFPPRLLHVQAVPDRLALVFDDEIDVDNPYVALTVDGVAAPSDNVAVSGRRVSIRLKTALAPGDRVLALNGVRNVPGRTGDVAEHHLRVPVILAPVVDRWHLVQKRQFTTSDRELVMRQALGFGTELTSQLQAVAWISNAIDGNTESSTFGWQGSHRYRSRPDRPTRWDVPSNARIMECIYAPLTSYVLNRSFNPYYHDPTVRARVVAALEYWLTLQGQDRGFPEYRGIGSQELPSTSFGLEFLVEIYKAMARDGTFPDGLADRVLDAVKRAAVWAATPGSASTIQGTGYTNQYCGALYGMWHLFRITGDATWKRMYDERLDGWLARGQILPYWYEADGVETFGYSRVTEWEMDRILVDNGDPRILESMRRYYEWAGLNTVVELDETTFIMDNLAHARTSANGPGLGVGYCNHIATVLPQARPWTHGYTATENEREKRVDAWFADTPTQASKFPQAARPSYNPFAGYMFFEPKGTWTITEAQRLEAVRRLPFLASDAFTQYYYSERGDDHFLFARRPGHYTTFHWGTPSRRQAKEIGLVWVPGFGTLFRSTNRQWQHAYCTTTGTRGTFRLPVSVHEIRVDGREAGIETVVAAADVALSYEFEPPGVRKIVHIGERRLSVDVTGPGDAVEQIPLYVRPDDTLSADGRPLRLGTDELDVTFRELRLERVLAGRSGSAVFGFGDVTDVRLSKAYDVAGGTVWLFRVEVPGGNQLTWWIGKE